MSRMSPIKDDAGKLRPDLDYRVVPLAVMATYLAISRQTLHRRVLRGEVKGTVSHGKHVYFKPREVIT